MGMVVAFFYKKMGLLINIWGVGDGIYVGGMYIGIVFLEDSSRKTCF
jgi:hypothetical protein